MPPSMTHSMLMGYLRWFENQTGNRPPDRVNSNSNSSGWHEVGCTRSTNAAHFAFPSRYLDFGTRLGHTIGMTYVYEEMAMLGWPDTGK